MKMRMSISSVSYLDDLLLTMEVATGKFLLTLTRPTPKPTAGGPKKC